MQTIYIVILCLVVGLAVCHPPRRIGERRHKRPGHVGVPGKGGPGKSGRPGPFIRPGKGGMPGKDGSPQRKELTDELSEKLFFCQMARRACKLMEAGEDPLVDRTCHNDAACDGPGGTITLNGTEYTITFCPRPEEELDEDERIQRMLNRERPEPNEELQEICKPPHKGRKEGSEKPERKPRWFYKACKVMDGEIENVTRACRGDVNCTKGPYEAELDGKEVEVTFCDRKRKEGEDDETEGEEEDDKKDEPFWYANACEVKAGEETIKELDDCPGGLKCITRLTDMDYDGKKVDAGYCGGFLLRKRRGRHGGRRGHGGSRGRFSGHRRHGPRGRSFGRRH